MIENNIESTAIDFVAKDLKHDRICICGHKDNFKAIKSQGKWKKGYPDFFDLIDNYSQVKEFSEIERLSLEARSLL